MQQALESLRRFAGIELAHAASDLQDAAAVARGLCRSLADSGCAAITEFVLKSGRRADVCALRPDGAIVIIEIKTSVADLRGDRKWPEYRDYCDEFFFAVPPGFPIEEIPDEVGLIVADAYEAAVLRPGEIERVAAARRKAVTLRFAHAAAGRLMRLMDPSI